MATTRDYYDVLGVPHGASDADLKRAFRKLTQQWHPDVNTEAGADERFKEINEAYRVLSDPQQRQAARRSPALAPSATCSMPFSAAPRPAADGAPARQRARTCATTYG